MFERRTFLKGFAGLGLALIAEGFNHLPAYAGKSREVFEITKTDTDWRAILTPEQYRVLRQGATEPPYENKYHNHKAKGTYHCAGCDLQLFSSKEKYDSRTGWPSFWQPKFSDAIRTKKDYRAIFPRTEVHCARCGGHLGHIFKDGPAPTYLRYCINSAALKFVPA